MKSLMGLRKLRNDQWMEKLKVIAGQDTIRCLRSTSNWALHSLESIHALYAFTLRDMWAMDERYMPEHTSIQYKSKVCLMDIMDTQFMPDACLILDTYPVYTQAIYSLYMLRKLSINLKKNLTISIVGICGLLYSFEEVFLVLINVASFFC